MEIKCKVGKYKRTPEMLRNYSEAAKNRKYTEEGRKKISEARKRQAAEGRHNCLGKKWKMSEEAIKKRLGKPGNHFGHKHTKEVREKMREANIKGRLRQAHMKEPTSIEKAVYDYLVCKGIVFEKQKSIGGGFIVDAYIPSLNLVIEADGKYWHSTPRGIETDKRKNKHLTNKGFDFIRLSEEEIKNDNFKNKLERVLNI